MSRKVFTAGEVLAAADVNSFLMDQTVMSFAGTAARGSAIPSPTEGMYTHLEDTDRLQFWNGSAWVSPFGMTLVNHTAFSSVASQTLNSIFTSEYDNYQIAINIQDSATQGYSSFQFTVSGTPTTANYVNIMAYADGGGTEIAALNNLLGTDELPAISHGATDNSSFVATIFAPNLAQHTKAVTQATGSFGANAMYVTNISGAQQSTTQFDGIKFNFPGNTTGTITVYGLRK